MKKNIIKDNSSTILTCIGAIGVVATGIMSARDTIKASKLIEKKREETEQLDLKDKIKLATPCYIPTFITGAISIGCIFGSNAINKKLQTALASSLALVTESYKEYREETKELYGEESDRKIRENIIKRHNNTEDVSNIEKKVNFFDYYSLNFFESTLKEVEDAERILNERLQEYGYVSLKDFYMLLGIDTLDTDDLLGWSTNAGALYGYDKIYFSNEKTITKDGTELYTIYLHTDPTNDYLYL